MKPRSAFCGIGDHCPDSCSKKMGDIEEDILILGLMAPQLSRYSDILTSSLQLSEDVEPVVMIALD